jgi:hypothetical protein
MGVARFFYYTGRLLQMIGLLAMPSAPKYRINGPKLNLIEFLGLHRLPINSLRVI